MDQSERAQVRDVNITRQRILKAARREFAEYGLHGARVDRIAEKSHANKSMIYYIFGGKEDLYLAALESLFEEKTELVDPQLMTATLSAAGVGGLIDAFIDVLARNEDAARMLIYDLATGAQTLRRLREKRPDLFQTFERLSDAVNGLMRAGMLPPLDADKSIIFPAMVALLLPVARSCMDLWRSPGTAEYQSLTSLDSWKTYVHDVLTQIMRPA